MHHQISHQVVALRRSVLPVGWGSGLEAYVRELDWCVELIGITLSPTARCWEYFHRLADLSNRRFAQLVRSCCPGGNGKSAQLRSYLFP
jgi:hypothetical protein